MIGSKPAYLGSEAAPPGLEPACPGSEAAPPGSEPACLGLEAAPPGLEPITGYKKEGEDKIMILLKS